MPVRPVARIRVYPREGGQAMVTIGIDTHKATLAVSAIDGTGRETGARTFPNDRRGHVGILR